MFKHILFDLDGTLTDPVEGILRSLRHTLEHFGLEQEDENQLKAFIGPPLADSFRSLYGFNEEQVAEAICLYRAHYAEDGIFGNKVMPGMVELLTRLQSEGKKMYVATTKMTAFAEQVLEIFKLDGFFSLVIGGNPDGTRTAKREIIAEILEVIPPREQKQAVMIGDRKYDIIGAKAHGMASIAVTFGYGSETELKNEEPDYLVSSVSELTRLLCQ
ncbi:HAD hydrolase-like protein [Dethiobacter alkaliphilus]|uniref:HAD hydrolase-like protein n=1 Tax=Dethiobacter alkaliphilus TaxID=427926 RepID=UPI002227CCEC|nr:HAD hydrolase-like protein [Dethiobacter alkaliphilus]MCW3490581.1 HAD hydrolase-like protein [Dethiobacter alkaliphilus]